MSRGGAEALTATTCTSTLRIGSNWDGKTNQTGMRLYNVKIYKSDALDRNYVPCIKDGTAGLYELVENKFFPLIGGKVSGATLAGQEFQIAPQAAKVSSSQKKKPRDKPTLTCLAAGAQWYEWYEDGVLMEGETSDSLTVQWRKMSDPYLVEYSVVPVYTVFNETVKGAPASATVKMLPCAFCAIVR